ncbi:hypothetical protein [Methylobacterium sp. B1]|uniref:cyanase n=1 Tax=Methylobacterium sp. B1 TaxID=91459 RepID=UPI0035B52ADA
MLNEPLIYRFYQRVMVYGTTFKELIQEGFGAASCRRSTSTWTWSARPATRATGRPGEAHHIGQVPAAQILRQQRRQAGIRAQIIMKSGPTGGLQRD